MFAIYFIKIFNRSIYVLIFNFFSDKYLILRATEDLNNAILFRFFREMGVYIKNLIMQFCCALFHVLLCKISISNLNFTFLPPTWVTILGDWGSYQKTI